MLYSWCIWQMLCSWCYSTSAIQREGIWQVPYRGGYLTSAIHGEGIWQVLDRGGVFDKCFTRQIFVSCNTGKGIWLAQKKESRTKERKGKQRKWGGHNNSKRTKQKESCGQTGNGNRREPGRSSFYSHHLRLEPIKGNKQKGFDGIIYNLWCH